MPALLSLAMTSHLQWPTSPNVRKLAQLSAKPILKTATRLHVLDLSFPRANVWVSNLLVLISSASGAGSGDRSRMKV